MSIVCGTDLSPAARAGAAAAAAFAAKLRTTVWLAHATGDAEHLLDAAQLASLRSTIARRLDEEAARIARLGGVPVQAVLLEGDAPRALLVLARARGASLVVVASQGHGASPLLRVGGTSERIALESEVPVVVARDPAPFERWLRGERPLRVVVGVDFTASTLAAWAWLATIRAAGECEVVAAHLYYADEAAQRYGDEPQPRGGGGVEAMLARDLLAFLGGADPAVRVRAQVALGRIADHLVDLAAEEGADLLVVGTHHRQHAARLWSVSGGALHFGRTAVATVPTAARQLGPVRPAGVARVLVATADDDRCAEAVALAYGMLACRAGLVHLLHVAPPSRGGDAAAQDAEIEARLRALAPVEAGREGITTTVEVAHGPVARTIGEVAERLGADVICVASRRRGRIGVPGRSVVSELLRRTRRPVLVVRPPPE